MDKAKSLTTALMQWWQRQRIARALGRYSAGMGGQLSGGIALTGLLSIAAALTIGLTAMMGVFRRHPDFRDVVYEQIDNVLPGIVGSGGMLSPGELEFSAGWNIAGIVAGLVLLNTATGVMKTLRISLQSMFGIHTAVENPVMGKLRDLLGFVALGSSILATAALSIVTRATFDWLHNAIGHWGIMPDSKVSLNLLTILIGLVVDSAVFMALFRGLAGARVPWEQLWRGALVGAIGTGTLRYLGTSVVANVSDKPLLGSVATVATLLVWLNIAARVTLLAAAFTADPPARPKITKEQLEHRDHTPNYVSVSAPETLDWEYGAYTGVVQPLPGDEDAYDPTAAAVAAKARAPRANPVARLKGFLADRNEPDGYVYPGADHASVDGQDGARPSPTGPPPLVRITPDSPLGRLRAKVATRRSR